MLLAGSGKGGTLQAAEKPKSAVILRSSSDEESRIALRILRAISSAYFTLSRQSEILRCAQNDSERAQDDSIVGFFRSLFSPALPASSKRGEKSGLMVLFPSGELTSAI
jgi:hypothetical protein